MADSDRIGFRRTEAVRFSQEIVSATQKTRLKNYFGFEDAILENGRFRRNRTLLHPHNPKQSKNHDSDAKNAPGKPLPVCDRHLGKWRISPSWKVAAFDRFGFREAQAVRFDREITTATRKSPFYKHLKHDVTLKSHFRVA